jgi:hypothetical protein
MPKEPNLDRYTAQIYQSFMDAYVRRINQATFGVTISGVKIGSAKYSRLAQINLDTRIITFSRFAIENVPERGRRYLVVHELAHVKEPSHNKRFWQLVEQFEPQYKAVDKALLRAFKLNVKKDDQKQRGTSPCFSISSGEPKLINMAEIEKIRAQAEPCREAEDIDNIDISDLRDPPAGSAEEMSLKPVQLLLPVDISI